MKDNLCIADVQFSFPEEISKTPINKYFTSFWTADVNHDLDCSINSFEFDGSLHQEPLQLENPCEFNIQGTQSTVIRRNPTGEILWSVTSLEGFQTVEIRVNPLCFSDHYFSLEDLVCRDLGLLLLVLILSKKEGLVFHGSATVLHGEGIMCVGASGVGKSTIAHILSESGYTVLSDERPVARGRVENEDEMPIPSDFWVYGSPWPSSGGFALNERAPLKRIYFLEHGSENKLTPLSATEAVARLMQVATIPWQDPALFDPCLKTVETLLASVPAAVLSFKPDEAVVDVIRRDLAAEKKVLG